MNERLIVLSVETGEVGTTLGAAFYFTKIPTDITIVGVSCAPSADDAGLTIDINDDGTGVITAIDCSDQDAPGEWKSTHFGGTNTPVSIAAGSEISLDANNAAANTRVWVNIWALVGEKSG
jgi:hypothetical protein